MNKAKGNICSQILERQRKIASLESDSSTQLQTLELIQQERVNLSTKLAEKRTSYGKIKEDLNTKLKEQQDWLNSHKSSSNLGTHSLVNTQTERSANESAGDFGALTTSESLVNAYKDTMTKFDAAKAMFDNLAKMRSEHTSERDKAKQALESLKGRMNSYKPELREMPNETLEEEIQVLMSDKCAETKYQESLQNQIDTIKGISHTVQCGCGEVYKVEVDPCV
nr:uncharacterized protein LOC122606600 isoform X2 [Erigeron canadensis]